MNEDLMQKIMGEVMKKMADAPENSYRKNATR